MSACDKGCGYPSRYLEHDCQPLTCKHQFEKHVGVPVFNDSIAWVQLVFVVGDTSDLEEMWRCVHCGEQGYEVPA